MLTLKQFASALCGKIVSGGVSFAPEGHGRRDASGRLFTDPTARNGYRIACLSPKDDPLRVRDYVDARCGLPLWEPGGGGWHGIGRIDPQEVARRDRAREKLGLAQKAEDRIKTERADHIWQEAEPDPRGTLVTRYLEEHRRLDLPRDVCGHAVRFHPAGPWEGSRAPMMLCALRDIHTNEVVGLHRTCLDPATAAKVGRKMLGRAKNTAIKLTHDFEVAAGLHIAEGIESALAGMAIGFAPMWAMGSVGGIAAFPVLSGIECLTICAETGDASAAAVERVGARWDEAGRELRVCRPRYGSDLNDAIREVRG
ncbi:DUF7146 domain-containing protein [Methylobacterium longum]|uniref:Toprim domain-containing protein n=1 Tax=Methylobacterium longum TaxID=767694 RepID=A0ABT8AXJ4_9HYPH|nr:toprim domain-containing protein [Methylobacterium longum]MDN3574285.1 toprim domain-containing protein [Methylobacterium longum]GJE13385.1 hypothetical protein FOHLNKBM_4448 [Methylobacterium longum]